MKMKMEEADILNKKLRVNRSGKDFYYTVIKINEITDKYVYFKDKFGKGQYCRWDDIAEVMECV